MSNGKPKRNGKKKEEAAKRTNWKQRRQEQEEKEKSYRYICEQPEASFWTEEAKVRVLIPIVPKAKQRPRLGKGNVYSPNKAFKLEVHYLLEQLFQTEIRPYFKQGTQLHVWTKFYFARPKSNNGKYPKTRADIDNYVKNLFDSVNGIIWYDDAQIVSEFSQMLFHPEDNLRYGIELLVSTTPLIN